MSAKSSVARTKKLELGDFQTPDSLASAVCRLLLSVGVNPLSIVEPNCGKGAFIMAALNCFKDVQKLVGVDINLEYIAALKPLAERHPVVRLIGCDFYKLEWEQVISQLPEPVLVLGNPPWITISGLSAIGGANSPTKVNFQNHSGLDAITGKSNFDISEWMLIKELEWLNGHQGVLAMLCKTAVARKVLLYAWKKRFQISRADIYSVDAENYFGASVDACLFICHMRPSSVSTQCSTYSSLKGASTGAFGLRDNSLVADLSTYDRLQPLRGPSARFRWRSGIKHDCSEVMELRAVGTCYRNGLEQRVNLEDDFLYPLLKGSDLANGRVEEPRKWMLVPQTHIGEDTRCIKDRAPKTWEYLCAHTGRFERRASAIYKGQPPFAVFGVGEYSFMPWKVAISALHKKLEFRVVGPAYGRPVVFDDTCYFVGCNSRDEAELVYNRLKSKAALEFYNSLIFWDAKRPITVHILSQLRLEDVQQDALPFPELNIDELGGTKGGKGVNAG